MRKFGFSMLAKAAALVGAGFIALAVPASAEGLDLHLDGVPTSIAVSGHGWIG